MREVSIYIFNFIRKNRLVLLFASFAKPDNSCASYASSSCNIHMKRESLGSLHFMMDDFAFGIDDLGFLCSFCEGPMYQLSLKSRFLTLYLDMLNTNMMRKIDLLRAYANS